MKYLVFSLLFIYLNSFSYTKPINEFNLQNIQIAETCNNLNLNLNCSDYKYSNTTCILCKTLVGTIDYEIKNGNNTIQEITEIIKNICCMVHGPRGNECVFVLNNIQQIVKMISNGLTNIQICKDLHLCN